MRRSNSSSLGGAPREHLRRLSEAANHAHERFQGAANLLQQVQDLPPRPGDLWVLPAAGDSELSSEAFGEDVEWAILEEAERGFFMVPADGSPLQGTTDVATAEGRVLRCALGAWFDPQILRGAQRTGSLEEAPLALARERRQNLKEGRSGGSLLAIETDRDPEYRQLLAAMRRTQDNLERQFRPQQEPPNNSATTPSLPPPLLNSLSAQRFWANPMALAAVFLLVAALGVIVMQWRTIDELRRRGEEPIVDSPIVWLEPLGERGASEVQAVASGAPYMVLLMRPERMGTPVDSYRLEIFAEGEGEQALWSGELSPGALPELFVLVPGHLLSAGEYRLLLTGRRAEEESPAGRFRLRVLERLPSDGD